MFAVSEKCTLNTGDIFNFIPPKIVNYLRYCPKEDIREIRLRLGRPLSVLKGDGAYFVTLGGGLTKLRHNLVTVTTEDIENAMGLLCDYSVYAHEDEIKNGYITVGSGHRVGICGDAVTENGKISFINNVSGLNYRVAHEIKGAADKVIEDIYNHSRIRSTLIVSPPGGGKTTLLRDIARRISDRGKNVAVIDERGEIAASEGGAFGFDVGAFTDVLRGCGKKEGMLLMLRSMSPRVIVTDELGDEEDFEAVSEALKRGVSVIATMHGDSLKDIEKKSGCLDKFSCIITLSDRLGAGTVEEIMIR